jgi:Na+-driven multidrug efflux pump
MMWGLATLVGVDGEARLVSVAVIIVDALNLFLDIVFIQWLGWGITGSSAATVVGHLVGIAILLTHWRKPSPLSLSIVHRPLSIIKRVLSQGAPLAVASISLTLLLLSANRIVLTTLGQAGIFAFAVCMNLLQVYNLFLSGTCQTLQSLGAIQVGKHDADGLRLVLRKSFRFITVAMIITCLFVWIDPQGIAALFGAHNPDYIAETNSALRIFALSFIPFCYIYVLMIVYKLHGHHRMALFISFALSLTIIPVMWIISRTAPGLLWYSYLIAYLIEAAVIFLLHRWNSIRFTIADKPAETHS